MWGNQGYLSSLHSCLHVCVSRNLINTIKSTWRKIIHSLFSFFSFLNIFTETIVTGFNKCISAQDSVSPKQHYITLLPLGILYCIGFTLKVIRCPGVSCPLLVLSVSGVHWGRPSPNWLWLFIPLSSAPPCSGHIAHLFLLQLGSEHHTALSQGNRSELSGGLTC